jgi:hypothetical protein
MKEFLYQLLVWTWFVGFVCTENFIQNEGIKFIIKIRSELYCECIDFILDRIIQSKKKSKLPLNVEYQLIYSFIFFTSFKLVLLPKMFYEFWYMSRQRLKSISNGGLSAVRIWSNRYMHNYGILLKTGWGGNMWSWVARLITVHGFQGDDWMVSDRFEISFI